MDGFSYVNIFDTKGIEYLVIIAFLLLLIPFWLILNKQAKLNKQMKKVLGILNAKSLNIPQGLFYNTSHTWTFLEKSGMAKVGLDDLLLHIVGEVKITPLKMNGETVTKGELIAQMEQNGKNLRVYSPISGKIIQTNPIIKNNSDILNEDPYGKGWLYSIKPSSWISDTYSYYLAEDASEWLAAELTRYKDFLAVKANNYSEEPSLAVLQDGGELIDHSLEAFPDELWQDFQQEFLNPAGCCVK